MVCRDSTSSDSLAVDTVEEWALSADNTLSVKEI